MINIAQVFVLLVELESLSEVARLLKISPSSISRQVDALEQELGTKLCVRTTRQVTITAAGRAYYEKASAALRLLSEAKESVRAVGTRQQLSINVFESFGSAVVMPALIRLLRDQPALSVALSFDNQIRPISHGGTDIFIRLTRPTDSSFIFKKLCRNEFKLYASPSYLRRRTIPSQPEDLLAHNCLSFHRVDKQSVSFRRGRRSIRLKLAGSLTSVGSLPLLRAAEDGLGIAILPTWLIPPTTDLQVVLSDWEVSQPSLADGFVHAIYPRELLGNPNVKALFRNITDGLARRGGIA